jgi:hypothetical protein
MWRGGVMMAECTITKINDLTEQSLFVFICISLTANIENDSPIFFFILVTGNIIIMPLEVGFIVISFNPPSMNNTKIVSVLATLAPVIVES